MLKRYLIIFATLVVATAGAYGYYAYIKAHSTLSNEALVRITVASFGDALQEVPLVAKLDIVAFAMDKYYSYYIHPDLLEKWKKDPLHAPGRLTSSPWPDRIDITSTTKNADGTYTIDAGIVEVVNGKTGFTVADTIPVRFVLTMGPDGWQITDYKKL